MDGWMYGGKVKLCANHQLKVALGLWRVIEVAVQLSLIFVPVTKSTHCLSSTNIPTVLVPVRTPTFGGYMGRNKPTCGRVGSS